VTRLHVFDMDGTLLRGVSSVELSRYLGVYETALAVETAWEAGQIDALGFWDAVLPLWADVGEDELDAAFAASPWIDGLRDVFTDIHRRGETVAVVSQSPHFFVRRLEAWGAHYTYGSAVAPHVPTTPDSTMTPEQKVDITLHLLDRLGLGEDDCVAYGDSTSDVPLFDRLRHTVGVNARDVLRPRAAVLYDGDDLREAYALARARLTSAAEAGRPS
jgi:phosphoserine phosphatase